MVVKKWNDLAEREKLALGTLALFVVVIGGWLLVYKPITEHRTLMAAKIERKEAELQEVTALASRIITLKSELSSFEERLARSAASSPIAETESLARSAGVSETITTMTPSAPVAKEGYSETTLQIAMKAVPLDALVRFLEGIEKADIAARVGRIVIKPSFQDRAELDVTLTLAFYEVTS